MLKNGLQYILFGTGPIASTSSEVMAFIRTKDASADPNLQLYCAPVMVPTPILKPPASHGITLIANLVKPKSRRSMRLRSADPGTPPIIEPNYYGDPRDLQALVDGIRYLRTIVETAPISRLVEQTLGPDPKLKSDDDIGTYCKAVAATKFHPVGSCRMGLDSDPLGGSHAETRRARRHRFAGLRCIDDAVDHQCEHQCCSNGGGGSCGRSNDGRRGVRVDANSALLSLSSLWMVTPASGCPFSPPVRRY